MTTIADSVSAAPATLSADAYNISIASEAKPDTSVSYTICNRETSSYDQVLLHYALLCFVNPGVSLIGLATNIISLAILKRSGLHKPSNILLFGLVIADTMSLFETMDYPVILMWFGPNKAFPQYCGFQYGAETNYFLIAALFVTTFVGFWGRYVNTIIPVFITLERLLAVFRPMTFKTIVTSIRTVVAVLFAFTFWLPWSLFYHTLLHVTVRPLPRNVTWMAPTGTEFHLQNVDILEYIENDVVDPLISWVPLSFIGVSSIVLAIKVKITLSQRRNLTSSEKKLSWSPRTTRTLMLSCLIFAGTHVAVSVFRQVAFHTIRIENVIHVEFIHLIYTLNASSNLLVYITTNKKMYEIFCHMLSCNYQNRYRHRDLSQ